MPWFWQSDEERRANDLNDESPAPPIPTPAPAAAYNAVTTPTGAHAIQVDFPIMDQPTPTPQLRGSKIEGSGYDKVLYDHDLVMVFRHGEGGEVKKPEDFTVDMFVALMMGKDQLKSRNYGRLIVDVFQRVFRTPRCYLNDQGQELLTSDVLGHGDDATQRRWEAEECLLIAEYERFIGSREPTTESKFCELIATAVSRRVQLACGLTTRMFKSCDGDEIIMTIKADDNDLRVEADRVDYRLQVSNKPFYAMLHQQKMDTVRQEIGEAEWHNSIVHLRKIRGCPPDEPDAPEMDPLLMSQGEEMQPKLAEALKCWGHTEEADGLFVDDDSCRPQTTAKASCWSRVFHSLMEISYDPRTYFAPYADYRHEPMYQPYYRRYPLAWHGKKEESIFTQKDRIRLTASIVHRHINTDALVVDGFLVGDMFALHDARALDDLRHSWALRWRMLNQPLHKIRYYFGEKIALYFAWLGFYTKMLVFPTVAGIITFIVVELRKQQIKDSPNEEANQGFILIAFALFVVIWSSIFAEVWKRKNHMFNAIWGMHGYHRKLRYRAQFRGTTSLHPVTDAEEMTFEDKAKRRRAFFVSVIVVLFMVLIVIVALIGLFYIKYLINNDKKSFVDKTYRPTLTYVTTAANAIQILVLNMVYRGVAKRLNEYENHRTDRDYENHLIIKVFLFQFCNSFASFFYIAFIKKYLEDQCINDDCMTELRDQLLILFLIRIIVGNTLEVVIPYLKYRFQLFLERKAVDQKTKHNYIEEQAKLVPYGQEEAFEDYNEMVIQFGFINLFVVAFPLTPLLAFVNNMMEIHVDAVKLCYVHRRPFPYAAKSIGAWFYILRVMSYIALGTNSALILWTSDLFEGKMEDTTKGFVFVLSCQICFMISSVIEKTVSDMPKQLHNLMERNEYIVAVVFKNMFSGDDSHLGEIAEDLDLTIYPNDQWDDRATPPSSLSTSGAAAALAAKMK